MGFVLVKLAHHVTLAQVAWLVGQFIACTFVSIAGNCQPPQKCTGPCQDLGLTEFWVCETWAEILLGRS